MASVCSSRKRYSVAERYPAAYGQPFSTFVGTLERKTRGSQYTPNVILSMSSVSFGSFLQSVHPLDFNRDKRSQGRDI